MERPKVTEIQARIDCNGCVQKIKKALSGITGIYDFHIDLPQQKIIIIGWADPEKMIKALKRTRKMATICSHAEAPDPAGQPTEGEAPPAPDAANSPPPQAQPAEISAAETTKNPPPPENPQPETEQLPPEVSDPNPVQAPPGPKDVQEVHLVYHHPPDYLHRYDYSQRYNHAQWNKYHPLHRFPREVRVPQPVHIIHSYSEYQPSPYVTEYEYVQSPPRYVHHAREDHYDDNNHRSSNRSGNITSIFSDEDPNACSIM